MSAPPPVLGSSQTVNWEPGSLILAVDSTDRRVSGYDHRTNITDLVCIRKLPHDPHPDSDHILDLSQNKVHNVKRLMSEDVVTPQVSVHLNTITVPYLNLKERWGKLIQKEGVK